MYQVFWAFLLLGFRFSSACDDCDPDLDLTTPQIVRRHGYPSEAHVIQTEDGYLLTVHRIPYGRNSSTSPRKVVFLQHGLLSSSSDWVLNGPNRSLAYILADNGYDVWMGNVRGNTYSRAHVNLSEDDQEFWNFTWHEMGIYDLPAAIDYILARVSGKKLFYIGHSMGTTMFFAMASIRPAYGAKVEAMFALAPVVYMSHIKSPIRILAPWANDIEVIRKAKPVPHLKIQVLKRSPIINDKMIMPLREAFLAKFLGAGAFLPNNKMMKLLSKFGCETVAWEKEICSNIIFVFCGFDRSQFNTTILPLILAHSPAGASTKTIIHYSQEINSGRYQEFDYGKSENLIKYGTPEPPQYNLSQIRTPVSLHYGDNDWLSSEIDVNRLYGELTVKIGKFLVDYKGFNHIDFLWGKDAKELVYDRVLKIMRTFTN